MIRKFLLSFVIAAFLLPGVAKADFVNTGQCETDFGRLPCAVWGDDYLWQDSFGFDNLGFYCDSNEGGLCRIPIPELEGFWTNAYLETQGGVEFDIKRSSLGLHYCAEVFNHPSCNGGPGPYLDPPFIQGLRVGAPQVRCVGTHLPCD